MVNARNLSTDKNLSTSSLACLQVILAFAQPIWPDGFFDVVCLDSFVPEFWVTRYRLTSPQGGALHGITGFLAGAAAEVASALAPEEILARALTQLDAMFGEAPCLWMCGDCVLTERLNTEH